MTITREHAGGVRDARQHLGKDLKYRAGEGTVRTSFTQEWCLECSCKLASIFILYVHS